MFYGPECLLAMLEVVVWYNLQCNLYATVYPPADVYIRSSVSPPVWMPPTALSSSYLEPLYEIFAQTVGDVDTTLPQVGGYNDLYFPKLYRSACSISLFTWTQFQYCANFN